MNLALAIVALGGCGADLPPIEVVALEPDWAYNGEVSEITVEGENFYPSVKASSFAEPTVESDFRAWVETDPPTEVDVFPASLTTLRVQIPPGIEEREDDPYDFTVESSDGTRDTLVNALLVTRSRAAYLDAVVLGNAASVGESVPVYLFVKNLDGNVEPESLEVEVSADTQNVEFDGATLDHQEPTATGVRGMLLQGQGYVRVKSNVEGWVRLTVEPAIDPSPVESDVADVNFSAGRIAEIQVVVDDSEPIVAGVPTRVDITFLDEHQQVVEEEGRTIRILESCNPLNHQESDVVGSATFPFTFERATLPATACPENRVIVWADGIEDAESQAVAVSPGAPDQLGVAASSEMVAGEAGGVVLVAMQDAYGNHLHDYETAGADVVLHASTEVLPDEAQSCDRFVSGYATCDVELSIADDDVTITARDGLGREGSSNPISVVPGPAFQIEVIPKVPAVQAGDPLEIRIYVMDEPGNVVDVEPDELHITDENEAPLDCRYDGVDLAIPYEVHVFECIFTEVGARRVVVDLVSAGMFDFESTDIGVTNGDLAQVSIDLGSTTSVAAGATFYADFVGTDAWGNPYVVKSDPYVEVRDGTGTLTPFVVELDATGRALGEPMNVKRATLSNRIVALQDGAWLGSSPVFAVTAGPLEEFFVDVDGPVVSVDDPGIVLVSAVDQYGNPVGSFDGTVDLVSSSSLGNPVRIASWVEGRAAVEFPFDMLGVQDTLVADDGARAGESAPFDVVDFHCAEGPVANLEVGSGLPLRVCLVPGMGATSFDLSSSVAGSEPIDVYYYLRGDGAGYRTVADSWSTTWTQPGGYAVSGIVIDRALCASESSGWVYVGYDDGQPTGPVDVSIAGGATTIHAWDGSVDVVVSARTCSGDPAIGGALLANVDIGALTVSGLNRSTGSGIEIVLDPFGDGEIEWSMAGQPAGGVGTFVAGARSGRAHGEVSIDIGGDTSHPTVLEVGPIGTHDDEFDTIAILFSDPMQESSIASDSVMLFGPSGAEIPLDDLALASSGSNEGRELLVSFEEQSGAAGAYTLRLTSDLRKAPGPYDNANTLDGDYGVGDSADFVVSFGGVSNAAPDVLTCDPSTPLFRPDGDDSGTDPFEADVVVLDLVATDPAAWWLLEVFDLAGNRVAMSHSGALDLDNGAVEWDGRGSDGTILDNGMYTLAVTAKDASWNEGAPCLANVIIDNVLVPVDE
jgi:hypothetical protein